MFFIQSCQTTTAKLITTRYRWPRVDPRECLEDRERRNGSDKKGIERHERKMTRLYCGNNHLIEHQVFINNAHVQCIRLYTNYVPWSAATATEAAATRIRGSSNERVATDRTAKCPRTRRLTSRTVNIPASRCEIYIRRSVESSHLVNDIRTHPSI